MIQTLLSSRRYVAQATINATGNLLEFSVFMYILNAGYPDTEMTYGYYS